MSSRATDVSTLVGGICLAAGAYFSLALAFQITLLGTSGHSPPALILFAMGHLWWVLVGLNWRSTGEPPLAGTLAVWRLYAIFALGFWSWVGLIGSGLLNSGQQPR